MREWLWEELACWVTSIVVVVGLVILREMERAQNPHALLRRS